jgi:Flp pilus assembly protein TadG
MVEFALVLPALLLATVLFLEAGQVLFRWGGLWRSVNAGARLASTGYDVATTEALVRETLNLSMVDDEAVTITIKSEDANGTPKCAPVDDTCRIEYGDIVVVEASTPFSFGILGYNYAGTLEAATRQKAERGAWSP